MKAEGAEHLVENSVAEKIDAYFKAERRWDGVYWSLKMPWNKQKTWLKPEAYFEFRYDIASLFGKSDNPAPLEADKELDEILDHYANHVWNHAVGKKDSVLTTLSRSEAKTALLAWRDKAIQNHIKFQEALKNGDKDE